MGKAGSRSAEGRQHAAALLDPLLLPPFPEDFGLDPAAVPAPFFVGAPDAAGVGPIRETPVLGPAVEVDPAAGRRAAPPDPGLPVVDDPDAGPVPPAQEGTGPVPLSESFEDGFSSLRFLAPAERLNPAPPPARPAEDGDGGAPAPVIPGVTRIGSGTDDVLTGGDGDDVLRGLGGGDVLDGGRGDDELDGGAGADTLRGGAGADRLVGGEGDDRLEAGSGDDRLFGGGGNDVLDGGSGADVLDGGPGDDLYVLDDPADIVAELPEASGGGFDTVRVVDSFLAAFGAADSVDFLFPGADAADALAPVHSVAENVERLEFAGGADYGAVGNAADNVILGNAGANRLLGGAGADVLEGAGGDDMLAGGPGNDVLRGGAGDDVYLFRAGDGGADTIEDLVGFDRARLEGFAPEVQLAGQVNAEGDLRAFLHDPTGTTPFFFTPVFTVVGYATNPDSFIGAELDGDFQAVDDFLV